MKPSFSIRDGYIKMPCGSTHNYMTCSLTVPHTIHKMIRNGIVVGSWKSLFMQEEQHEQQSTNAAA